MEQAKRLACLDYVGDQRDPAPPEPSHDNADASDALNNIRKLVTTPKTKSPEAIHAPGQGQRRGVPDERNLMQALNLIHRDSKAIDQTEERARETEARARALAERAIKEVRAIEGRLRAAETSLWEAEARAEAAEQQARDAQTRAEAAERRSRDAEEWLGRFHSAVMTRFSARLNG
jgi:hypothetical protein